MPGFLITLDAAYCSQCSDTDFCSLVEHEMYHVAQELDQYGAPKFDRASGKPKLTIRGHDVEEFVGVVARYGATGAVDVMVKAAKKGPSVAAGSVSSACGTCLRAAA